MNKRRLIGLMASVLVVAVTLVLVTITVMGAGATVQRAYTAQVYIPNTQSPDFNGRLAPVVYPSMEVFYDKELTRPYGVGYRAEGYYNSGFNLPIVMGDNPIEQLKPFRYSTQEVYYDNSRIDGATVNVVSTLSPAVGNFTWTNDYSGAVGVITLYIDMIQTQAYPESLPRFIPIGSPGSIVNTIDFTIVFQGAELIP